MMSLGLQLGRDLLAFFADDKRRCKRSLRLLILYFSGQLTQYLQLLLKVIPPSAMPDC
jgi:hypothetical protein